MGRRRKYCSAQPYLDYIGVSERERKEMAKINYTIDWEVWKELCAEWKIDPYEYVDFSIGTGGGNSTDYEYIGETPERDEEWGNARDAYNGEREEE